MNSTLNNDQSAPIDYSLALPAIFEILDRWKCDKETQRRLLGLSARSTLHKYRTNPKSAKINPDLAERMSYILNIHKNLRIQFSHPESVYNWVNHANTHPFFNGRTALDVMKQGRVADLYNVAERLNAFRAGES
ncbi:MAG: DUF2384 domain-containing protein [Oleiphilus sp.]|nr:MAG: DUF2384 domain-containing protein [Oleiphilus sp.]